MPQSYRGATIWLYYRVRYNKNDSIKPESYSDAEANWYDPETGAFFEATFFSPTYHINQEKEEWTRPYNVLSKDRLLEYVKEIIDLNR